MTKNLPIKPTRTEPCYVTFAPLRRTISAKGMKMSDLWNVVSRNTVSIMNKDEYVSLETVAKVARYLDVPISEVVEVILEDSEFEKQAE